MRRYLPSIKKFFWIAVACAVVGVVAGFALAKAQPISYTVSSTVYVNATAPYTTITQGGGSPTDSITQANDYAAQIPTRLIMNYIYQSDPKLHARGFTANDLILDVTALVPNPLAANIVITATTLKSEDAVLLANDVAQGFIAYKTQDLQTQLAASRDSLNKQIAALQTQSSNLEAQILHYVNSSDPHVAVYSTDRQQVLSQITALQQQLNQLPPIIRSDVFPLQLAQPTDVQTSLHSTTTIAIAGIVGLALGLLLMLLFVFLDDRLRGDDQVGIKLGMSYIGGLSTNAEIKSGTIPSTGKVSQQMADIAANLHLSKILPGQWRAPQGTSLLITSAQVAEGKTTVAAALAGSLARGGRSVLVIDGDLRNPATHLAFGMSPASFGLSGLLKATGAENLDAAVQRTTTPGVWLLAGGAPMDEGTLLLEQKLPGILSQLSKKTDFVIIDGPSLLSSADASIMANIVEGVVMVIDFRHDKMKMLLRAKDILRSVTQKPIGVVINRLSAKIRNPYYTVAYIEEAEANETASSQNYKRNGNSNGHDAILPVAAPMGGPGSSGGPGSPISNSGYSVPLSPGGRPVSSTRVMQPDATIRPMDFPMMQPNPNPSSPFPSPRRMDMTPPQS